MNRLRDEFAAHVAAGERCDLARAALVIARIVEPDLDGERALATLDTLAATVRPRLQGEPPETAARVLVAYLFGECGFRGNEDDFYDPRNSSLDAVLERRLGIPITLAVVLMEVGKRVGLAIEGVGFPGHFLVRIDGTGGHLLLDPFYGGRPVTEEELRARYRTLGGSGADLPPDALEPAGRLAILARMLRNLLHVYLDRADQTRALQSVDLLLVLGPDAAPEVRVRGLLYEQLECAGAALADYRRYLELAPEAGDADAIRERVVRLTRAAAALH